MKIEKINDNQIRCTLTSDDLASREIKLSELAYGTDKAKNLFRDMMQKAHNEFGFEADNIPLMIEAIPVTPDSIVLIITKVEDPEELDTRFSNFSQPEENSMDASETPQITGADDIIDIFQKIYEAKTKGRAAKKEKETPEKEENTAQEPSVNLLRLFTFLQLDDVIEAAHALNRYFDGHNTLYKNAEGSYSLVLHQSDCSPEEFNRVCNMLSEYGHGKAFSAAGEAYLTEHGEIVIMDCALQQLAAI
ncbi:MAG: adaptor protein MecA [Ruminococcus sp.]|jgi:adapter protein MecA 1/2